MSNAPSTPSVVTRQRPFVYIAGLIRTGSTALSEALSERGLAFVVREPRLGAGRVSIPDPDAEVLRGYGLGGALHLPGLAVRALRRVGARGAAAALAVRAFRRGVAWPLAARGVQVGIKEVRHDGWAHVLRAFPHARVVAIRRDPRDIYLSQRARILARGNALPAPEAFAASLRREAEQQYALVQRAAYSMSIRYEDLCTDPSTLHSVRAFVQSPVKGEGSLGSFTAQVPIRRGESALHGGRLTDRRVGLWRRETDAEALAAAERVRVLMGPLVEAWGYDASGPVAARLDDATSR